MGTDVGGFGRHLNAFQLKRLECGYICIECVDEFCYLGNIIGADGGMKARIRVAGENLGSCSPC